MPSTITKHIFHSLPTIMILLVFLFSGNEIFGQTIQVPKIDKKQKIIMMYKMDHFFIYPEVLMNELIWLNKYTEQNNYADEIKYLRMANEKIEFTFGQKEFRNMSEDKIYHILLKILPKMLCDEKVSHIDRHTKKPSVTLSKTICEEKDAGYAKVVTQKGKVIFDCDGKYLPQQP